MADSEAFELACETLGRHTDLDRLSARGTVRLALKEAGLDAASVTPSQLAVVAKNVLPGELRSRGVGDGDRVCAELADALSRLRPSAARGDTPDAIFARLGGK